MQRTLILCKPDAMKRRLGGEVISRLEKCGLKVIAMRMLWMNEALAKRHYDIHTDKPFFSDLVKYITSGPIIAAAFEGENAIAVARDAMGATDPAKAATGTIRGDLGENIERNVVHGSDSEENAAIEIANFFKTEEIFDYPTES
ncbi:MAG: nucleoside-diphosphate kinase [Chloroflexota bacterium]|nr:nucleoside-diphosphate kinase [Chloroflexota bacterium]